MVKLEAIKPRSIVHGLAAHGAATVIQVQPVGEDALTVFYNVTGFAYYPKPWRFSQVSSRGSRTMPREATIGRDGLFAILVALLAILTLFYLVRPAALMLLTYGFGLGPDTDAGSPATYAGPSGQQLQAPTCLDQGAAPIAPPAPPVSLSSDQLPERWVAPITVSPDMRQLSDVIFALTNQDRTTRGLGSLVSDPMLSEIAARHSKDMLENDYLAHESRDGDGPAQRVGTLHRTLFGSIRENVASYSSGGATPDELAAQFDNQWMNSLGHRRNILSDDSDRLGVGCYEEPDPQLHVDTMRKCTQLFSSAVGYAEAPIPSQVRVGETLPLAIRPVQGQPMPIAVIQLDLGSDRPVSAGQPAKLSDRGGVLEGQLRVSGPPGTYGLAIHVPIPGGGGRYLIVPGPYLKVR